MVVTVVTVMMVVVTTAIVSFNKSVVVLVVKFLLNAREAFLCVSHLLGKYVQAVSGDVLGLACPVAACRGSPLLEQASDLVFGGLEALRACEVLSVGGLYDELVDVHEDLCVGQPKALALGAELGEVRHVVAGLHYHFLRERPVLVEQVERPRDLDAHRLYEGRLLRVAAAAVLHCCRYFSPF